MGGGERCTPHHLKIITNTQQRVVKSSAMKFLTRLVWPVTHSWFMGIRFGPCKQTFSGISFKKVALLHMHATTFRFSVLNQMLRWLAYLDANFPTRYSQLSHSSSISLASRCFLPMLIHTVKWTDPTIKTIRRLLSSLLLTSHFQNLHLPLRPPIPII